MTKMELNRLKLAMIRTNSEKDIEAYNEALANFEAAFNLVGTIDDAAKKNPSLEQLVGLKIEETQQLIQILQEDNELLKLENQELKDIVSKFSPQATVSPVVKTIAEPIPEKKKSSKS